ncbi:hypothetical protein FQR65_LT10417 [Abscondita terminalis]|nr:hypothetical protein FQR65_LT10417 [Abscondita terminalis]
MLAPVQATNFDKSESMLDKSKNMEESKQQYHFYTAGLIPSQGTSLSDTHHVPITDVSSLPKATNISRQRSAGNRGKIGVLNTSSEILALKEKVMQKDEKKRRKSLRSMKNRIKIRVDIENQDTESVMETYNEDDAACIYCNELKMGSIRTQKK